MRWITQSHPSPDSKRAFLRRCVIVSAMNCSNPIQDLLLGKPSLEEKQNHKTSLGNPLEWEEIFQNINFVADIMHDFLLFRIKTQNRFPFSDMSMNRSSQKNSGSLNRTSFTEALTENSATETTEGIGAAALLGSPFQSHQRTDIGWDTASSGQK